MQLGESSCDREQNTRGKVKGLQLVLSLKGQQTSDFQDPDTSTSQQIRIEQQGLAAVCCSENKILNRAVSTG